jgi:hypothetical protein
MIPATLATPWSSPSHAAMTASIVRLSATSPATVLTSDSGSDAFTSSSRSATMSVATTLAPSSASLTAVARPIPEPAPVTMTVFP